MRHPVEYEVIYSNRKTVAIQVTREGKVRVRAPRRCSRSFIDTFVTGHEDWIQKHLEQAQRFIVPWSRERLYWSGSFM